MEIFPKLNCLHKNPYLVEHLFIFLIIQSERNSGSARCGVFCRFCCCFAFLNSHLPIPILYTIHPLFATMYRYTFSLCHKIDKSSCSLWFWAPDPLIKKIYKNLLIKGLEPKNKSHLNLYEKVYLMFYLDGLYIVSNMRSPWVHQKYLFQMNGVTVKC